MTEIPDHNRIEQLFQEARQLAPQDRPAYLDAQGVPDAIRHEVEELLRYDAIQQGGLTADVDDRLAATAGIAVQGGLQGAAAAGSLSGSAIDHGRFVPGTILAQRYRIIGMLGKGGMGEVYRADDLELGQSVALKFLPKKLVDDPRSLERFRGEVRLARQVSHPNVCRVYDIGQIDGQWFLSMEYVDGEDLAQLLRRIGRFPTDRATELARQLCLGLHAAHDKGVLHRDLKPANIMIDGRGKLLITDFGLAEIAEEVRGDDIRSGTPAYMSPEQLAGREVTQQSDIYSLGIILHEIYTGKPVWEAGSMAELFQKRKSQPAPSPSSHVGDLDPIVDRVIQRCLEPDPKQRPASALAVTAALPGGDPIAAALAAGETPSPAMVAASGEKAALKPPQAFALLIGMMLVICLGVFLQDGLRLHTDQLPVKPPVALADRAQALIRELGYDPAPEDQAYDYFLVQHNDRPVFRFGYRQRSQIRFGGNHFYHERGGFGFHRPTFQTPAWQYPGETGLLLTPAGNLRFFRSIPRIETDLNPVTDSAPWNQWFSPDVCGFVLADSADATPSAAAGEFPMLTTVPGQTRTPPDAADAVSVWSGTIAEGETIYVVAAAYRGKPVYFEVLSAAEFNQPPEQAVAAYAQIVSSDASRAAGSLIFVTVINVCIVIALVMAIYNYRTGRSDRRGSQRVAWFVCCVQLAVMFSLAHKLSLTSHWWPLFGQVLVPAAVVWTIYVAVEPLVRKIWPKLLISWTRLLEGRFADPGVGQALLVGSFVAAFIWLSSLSIIRGYHQFNSELATRTTFTPLALAGSKELFAAVLLMPIMALTRSLFSLLILLVLRVSFRHERPAQAGCVVILTVMGILLLDYDPRFWPMFLVSAMLQVWTLVRFGFLANVTLHTTHMILYTFPITLDSSRWYYGHGLFGIAVVLLVAGYGCYAALGGRSFVRDLSG